MARFYMLQHKKDRAEQVLADAKKAMPDNPDGYRLLGDFYFSTGETDKALAEYASLLQEHQNDLKLKKSYIATLLLRNRVDEAARLNDEILNKNPQDVEALVARGRILVTQHKGDDAAQALEKAVKSEPDNAAAHYYLALAADLNGDANRREQELREAVRLRSDFLEAQTALATVALRKRDWDTLRTSADVVLKSQPSSPRATSCAAWRKSVARTPPGAKLTLSKPSRSHRKIPAAIFVSANFGWRKAASRKPISCWNRHSIWTPTLRKACNC